MEEKDIYDEYKVLPPFWGWAILIVFCAMILGYGMWSHHMVQNIKRQWDFGQLPDTPGQSVYSTVEPTVSEAPRQITPLPGRQDSSRIGSSGGKR